MSIKEFEDIIDKATIQMGDYTDTYEFFRHSWGSLIAKNPYMRLKEAIEIKNMYDLMNSGLEIVKPKHGGSKKATKKKKKRK